MAARLLDDKSIAAAVAGLSEATREAVGRVTGATAEPLSGMPLLVYALLTEQQRPAGAYDLMATISRLSGRPVKPPTVYRAIEQLIGRRLVARLATRNAFVTCSHPGHSHDCVLLVCDRCGRTAEFEDGRLDKLILEDARKAGFEPVHRTIEIEGTCGTCRDEGEHR